MNKAYTKQTFVNNSTPALNADNLNQITEALDTIDDRVIELNNKSFDFPLTASIPSTLTDSSSESIKALDVVGYSEQYISDNIYKVVSGTKSGVTFTIQSDGGIKISGTSTEDIQWQSNISASVGTYTISYTLSGTTPTSLYIRTRNASSAIDGVSLNVSGTSGSGTFTPTTDIAMTCLTLIHGNTYDCVIYIMMNSGSTALPYEKYTGTPTPTNPISIVDADGEITSHTVNLYDESKKIFGVFSDSGVLSTASVADSYASDYISVSEGNYTLSFTREGVSVYPRVIGFDSNKTLLTSPLLAKNTDTSLGKKTISVAVPSGCEYIRFNYPAASSETQFEVGTTAHDYSSEVASNTITLPYTLRSIGDVHDEIVVNEDGSGSYIQRVGVVDLASLTWNYDSTNLRFTGAESTHKQTNRQTAILCSIYTAKSSGESYDSSWDNVIYSGGTNLVIHDRRFTDSASLVSALADITCYVELATEVTTPLTSAQVSAILALQTYKTTSVIECEVSGSLTYQGDLKAYIDNKLG